MLNLSLSSMPRVLAYTMLRGKTSQSVGTDISTLAECDWQRINKRWNTTRPCYSKLIAQNYLFQA